MSLRIMTTQQTPPYASEKILFRTRSEFLTDQRVIVDGEIYPLAAIKRARVVRLLYFWPIQFLRLAALALTVALILDISGLVALHLPVTSVIVGGVLVLLLAGCAYVAPDIVPMYALQLDVPRGKVRFLYSSDADHLHGIVHKMIAAMEALDR
jgi:hypothetical protein